MRTAISLYVFAGGRHLTCYLVPLYKMRGLYAPRVSVWKHLEED